MCLPTEEPLVEEALDLLDRYAAGAVRLAVPDLFWAEMTNILWKVVRTGRFTKQKAENGLAVIQRRGITTISSFQLADRALSIATAFHRTGYDSIYLALAVDSSATFVTADEKLANAVAAHLPVKWLGAL